MAFSLPDRFLSFLVAVESTGGIFKSACNHFLGGIVSSVFKVQEDGTFGLVGVASGRLTGSYQECSARSAHSIGRFGIRGRCMADSGRGSTGVGPRGLSDGVV